MKPFEEKYFKEMAFTRRQIDKFTESAVKYLTIAEKSEFPEVKFQFSYDSLIKIGIALIASQGYKVSSRAGHHAKILDKISETLKDEEISSIANKMRKKRNKDLYDGGIIISIKQAEEYLDFVEKVINNSQDFLKSHFNKLL